MIVEAITENLQKISKSKCSNSNQLKKPQQINKSSRLFPFPSNLWVFKKLVFRSQLLVIETKRGVRRLQTSALISQFCSPDLQMQSYKRIGKGAKAWRAQMKSAATHHGMRNIYFAAFSLETINSRNSSSKCSKFSSSLSTAENVLSSSVSLSLEFHCHKHYSLSLSLSVLLLFLINKHWFDRMTFFASTAASARIIYR